MVSLARELKAKGYRKYVEFAVLCLLAAALLWWFGRNLDWREVRHALSTADPLLLAIAVVLICLAYLVRAYRWGALLKPLGSARLADLFAATAIGFGRLTILLRHAIPNTVHLMFINFSLLLIGAIKNEVVLSFLGLGVKVGPSWGRMIQESTQQVINGFFWQIGAATAFMFVLVLAFNIVSDALQDAFDPKHVG